MPRSYGSPDRQVSLQFGPIRNSDFLSSHWIERRLIDEPEWRAFEEQANDALKVVAAIWEVEKCRVAQYPTEQSLEYAFIQKVFDAVGWKLIYQTHLKSRKPDYALFVDNSFLDAALATEKNDPGFWNYPSVVADAKAWDKNLDVKWKSTSGIEYPPQQIEWYLDKSGLGYGILTNGRLWRLYPRKLELYQRRFQTYLECDLVRILEAYNSAQIPVKMEAAANFRTFYLLFGPVAYVPGAREPLIERAIKGSSEYRLGVGADLKNRVYEALRLAIQGYLRYEPNGLTADSDLALCRENAFVLLFRLLFVMYAEDRRLLPYGINHTYTRNRSLGRSRDDFASKLDSLGRPGAEDFKRDSAAIWEDLITLFDMVDSGHRTYGVPPYDGGLFDPENHPFLVANKIDDWHLSRIIDQIGRARDVTHPDRGVFRVDYKDLQIEHLGDIYEGLLELAPKVADHDYRVVTRRNRDGIWVEKLVLAAELLPRTWSETNMSYATGDIIVSTERGERRRTGSYYTPDHIVNYIVTATLQPLCDAISHPISLRTAAASTAMEAATSAQERTAIASDLQGIAEEYVRAILDLKVVDPAMGSGHFILRACSFLAEEIATSPHCPSQNGGDYSGLDSELLEWKRQVAEHCIFGVDCNPLAVELAKLAMWLETVSIDKPLTFLDHHLKCGNSLVGARIGELASPRGSAGLFGVADELGKMSPRLVAIQQEIANTPTNTPEQAKAKGRHLAAARQLTSPLLHLSHLWCAWYFGASRPSDADYQSAGRLLGRPKKFAEFVATHQLVHMIEHISKRELCFHWELEFPDVFLNPAADIGFDAVIGNPPYDVVSDLETGIDHTQFREYLEGQPRFAPAISGKINLYKLFLCQSLHLLRHAGRLGYILPMSVLGDWYSRHVRETLFKETSLRMIESFPQKDDPANRVFEQAKQSTAILILVKDSSDEARSVPCVLRAHPGAKILADSPTFTFHTKDVSSFDSESHAVPSCSQADWDLVARILNSGRLLKLGSICESFQGEVNETTERSRNGHTDDQMSGAQILRGSNICRYALRAASQGVPRYINRTRFLDGKGPDTKAHHFQLERVGFQRSAPQNNYRRLIATRIPPGEHCFDTVSYVTVDSSLLPLPTVLALLNSELLEWFFRLGSTTSKVSEFQFNNLPCPRFRDLAHDGETETVRAAIMSINCRDYNAARETIAGLLTEPPFSPALFELFGACVNRIEELELARGEITRRERASLAPDADAIQTFLNEVVFEMAGVRDAERDGLRRRLLTML